ncbi:MAG: glycosyltransferase family 2 protein [Saprospiraceae bacterium]
MHISIVIPTRNEALWISQNIRHIQQCARNYQGSLSLLEIIVVDADSQDDTVVLAYHEGASVISVSSPSRSIQLDTGAKQSKGDILYFVHADSLPPSTFMADIEKAFADGYRMGNFQYRFDRTHWLLNINAFCTRYRWFFTQGGDRTFFIHRPLYFEIGGYDPDYVVMEEYDFLRRAMRKGHHFAMLDSKCTVSSRKYNNRSWLRVQLANFIVYQCWNWSLLRPIQLKTLYKKLLG